jgi:hypothetical protein
MLLPPSNSPPLPAPPAANANHIAVFEPLDRFDSLRRIDDLLDEGVHTVFGIQGEEATLHALIFQADRFSVAAALRWLKERGLRPLQIGGMPAFLPAN